MPTQSQVQQTILSAQYVMAVQSTGNANNMAAGFKSNGFGFLKKLYCYIQAVKRQYALNDFSSPNFLIVYNCLCKMVGMDTTVNTIDPNYQGPSFIIDVESPIFAPTILNKTEADLVDAGGGNWYLPYLDSDGNAIPGGIVPVAILSNNQSIPASGFDATTTPPRIYGFASNNSQTIIITSI